MKPLMYYINRRVAKKNGIPYWEYYFTDQIGKFIRVIDEAECKFISKQISNHLVANVDKIWDRMGTGASLGEVI